ncbi:hypothetical protein [Marinilactibacillus psychrotolerans]|uniref:Uncharacterized protein n=1 Tax=Marinilactibacillus psychrotolerans TaxID=191770 RepID=A0A5R9C788_9LACT|nr:hypothetical protein [Marinilactibacillus psychrotolerans]TLQ08885.1 hypothetical protein FEZ48_03095 [Marinilactibacillus psychrotolerans]GEQ33340.1 hypothetical protein B795N_12220 [Marinilactibacillus psychrotolerans]
MINKYRKFIEEHPYAHIILVMLLTSFIGISIEYIVNRDFIGSGIYTAIGLTLIEFLRVKRRKRKNENA